MVTDIGAPVRVLSWSERSEPEAMYPDGIDGAVAEMLREAGGFDVRTATIDDPDLGLSEVDLEWAEVLVYFSHVRHREVDDATDTVRLLGEIANATSIKRADLRSLLGSTD